MKEYPKNRTDLILGACIGEDMEKLVSLKMKYRGLEEKDDFIRHVDALLGILKRVD